MSSPYGALVVFGSGPGVGRNVAALFAERGFGKLVLLSRDAILLAQDAAFVRSARSGASVHEVIVDLGNPNHVQKSLEIVDESLKDTPLECVLFNAARTGKGILSLYTVAQWAIPRFLNLAATSPKTPSLLVTSGMLAKDPFPAMFSLAAGKAGQYSLVQSLHKQFESKGVHCGLVIIGGTVSDNSKVTKARNIAEETWAMFSQPQGTGRLEVVFNDPAHLQHIKNRER